jgi:hypothetical protein
MRPFRKSFCAGLPVMVVLAGAAALQAADPQLPDFLPTGTRVMIGVRLANIVNSPLAQGAAAASATQGADWLKLATAMGFDPIHDIDELLIASTGEGQNAPAVIVARGRFNLERLGAGAEKYHGVALVGTGGKATGRIALLDASTAILGELPQIRAAIDRRGKGGHIDAALASKVEALRLKYDVWGLGDRPGGFASTEAEKAQDLDSVDRFEFGISMSHGLEATAELHLRPGKNGEKLNASLQLMEAMLRSQQPSSNAAKFDVKTEKGSIKIALAIPEEELKKAIAQRAMGTPVSSQAVGLKPAEPSKPPGIVYTEGGTGVVTLPGKK